MALFDQVMLPTRITRALAAVMVGDMVAPDHVALDLRTALPTVHHRRAMRGVLRTLYGNGNRGDLALLGSAAGDIPATTLLPLLGYTLRDGKFVAHGISMPRRWPDRLPPGEDTPAAWAGLRVHRWVRTICPPEGE